jgi:hypothetical protein
MSGSDSAVPSGVELPSRPPALLHTQVMRQHLPTTEGLDGHGGWPG